MTAENEPSFSHPALSEFEATIRQRAERLGITMSELGARDRELFSIPDPLDDCLDPYEVEQLLSGDLSESRAAHLDGCSFCAAMIDVARPTEHWLDEFIRSEAAQSALKFGCIQKKQNVWKPLVQASVLICGTIGFAGVAFALYTSRLNDALLSTLVKDTAPSSAILILSVALLSLFVAGWGASFFLLLVSASKIRVALPLAVYLLALLPRTLPMQALTLRRTMEACKARNTAF